MSMELYKKIIDDVSEFPDKLKMLRIAQHGEPLMHPQLPEMIRYAKDKGVSEFTEIVTNGSLLKPELNQALVDSGLDRIRISIEEITAEGYLKIAGAKIDYQMLIANIKDLFERSVRAGGSLEVYIKTVDAVVPTKEKEETFYRLFEDICHKIWIEHIVPLWSGWNDLSDRFELQGVGTDGKALRGVEICSPSLYSFTIAPDGIASVCCADWERKLVIGDLNSQSVKDVWNGDILKQFWIDMLSGNKSKYPVCASCEYIAYQCQQLKVRY